MADDVIVKHPTIDGVFHKVPADAVKDWTDQGWVRVKRDDEPDYPDAKPVTT